MSSNAATSFISLPSARSWSTSRSRALNSRIDGGTPRRVNASSTMPFEIRGDTYDLPRNASRMAVVSADAAESFSRYPDVTAKALRQTGARGRREEDQLDLRMKRLSCSPASRPLSSGMPMSTTTTSGCKSAARRSAPVDDGPDDVEFRLQSVSACATARDRRRAGLRHVSSTARTTPRAPG